MNPTPQPLLVTMGDPAGIGPEITWRAWDALRADPSLTFAVIAPPDVLRQVSRPDHPIAGIDGPDEAAAVFPDRLPVIPISGNATTPGQPDPSKAESITRSIERGVDLCLSGEAAGLVTNPIAKEVLYRAGFSFPGHTEYLGALCSGHTPPYHGGPVMMLVAPDGDQPDFRVGLATIHIPLRETFTALSADAVLSSARTMLGALKTDFGLTKPRLAVCGLNPHAGENGTIGTEERDIINPVCALLRDEGHDITDALPADTLFHADARRTYDGVLAMYHDQGLIPVKTLDFHRGVNITLGLPVVRTSPDHGTAFDIAGTGLARADSLIAAIRKAREIADCRHG